MFNQLLDDDELFGPKLWIEGLVGPTVYTDDSGEITRWVSLYKIDKKAATRVWYMESQGSRHRTVTGVLEGKMVTSEWTKCEAKNVGKANRVTASKQAEIEVEQHYRKKLKLNWTDSIPLIATWKSRFFEPMLAESIDDVKLRYPLFSQPKLDGHRCLARADGLWTRKGELYLSVPHIEAALKPFFDEYPLAVIDGELYNHVFQEDFNSLSSILRKTKPLTKEQLATTTNFAQFHIYDMVMSDEDTNPYEFRLMYNMGKLYDFLDIGSTFQIVRTDIAKHEEHMHELMEEYLELGYEGQILRFNTPYENKRTKNLVKHKLFKDDEYEIVEIHEGNGNWSGHAKMLTLRYEKGTFRASLRGDKTYCKQIWEDRETYPGKLATIRYPSKTPAGKPKHAVATDLDVRDK